MPVDVAPLVALPPRPAWLGATPQPIGAIDADGVSLAITAHAEQLLLRATVHDAAHLDDPALATATRRAYLRLARTLDERRQHAWRFWNYVPDLLAPAQLAENRYQVFNTGRFEALRSWYGERIADHLVAATAVGHEGADLVIDLLAGASQASSVENPRQISPLHYSSRWGPRPPCFARAVLVTPGGLGSRRLVLVSGTASIVGEDSRHAGEPSAQIDETLANLVALLEEVERLTRARAAFTSLRAYVAPRVAAESVMQAASQRFPVPIETVAAHLCRPELVVEIEGVATIDG